MISMLSSSSLMPFFHSIHPCSHSIFIFIAIRSEKGKGETTRWEKVLMEILINFKLAEVNELSGTS